MRKRLLVYIILITLILSTMLFIIAKLYHIKSDISQNESDIILLQDFKINGEEADFNEHSVNAPGIFECITYIKGTEFDKINETTLLIIPRIRGEWHKIYFNDSLIGIIGEEGNARIHLWNDVHKFIIPKELINDNNTLMFKTYSEHKIGYGEDPIFISSEQFGNDVYFALKMMRQNLYFFVIGLLLSVSLLEIVVFLFTANYRKINLLIPISILLTCVYLLEYIVIEHPLMSALNFKKLLILALYGSMSTMSFYLIKIYNSKILKVLSGILILSCGLIVIFSNDFLIFSSLYKKLNLLLLLLILSFIILAFRNYIKYKKQRDFIIGISTLFLFTTSLHDVTSLLFYNGRLMRLVIYGITIYSIGMLHVALLNYMEHQKKIYSEKEVLKAEKKRLENVLMIDELTGLYNHRHFYEVFNSKVQDNSGIVTIMVIDIDKFRPINELKGHKNGDEILTEIAQSILSVVSNKDAVFRYAGKTFTVICDLDLLIKTEQIAETIRHDIIKNKALQNKTGYLPLSVSIGISSYPQDASDTEIIVQNARKALLYAKSNGRNQVCVYSPSIDSKISEYSDDKEKNQLLLDFVYALASAIDLKDNYTGFHSQEVSRYAILIAEEMHLGNAMNYSLKLGGLLHDLGKLAISDSIITKNGKLTKKEYAQVKAHPKAGYDIVKHLIGDNAAVACVRSHHERYDGKGYPDGLKGNNIPLSARILCVADAFHAMISTRSYRIAMSQEDALAELTRASGSQFDPTIVDAFIRGLPQK